MDQTYKNLRLLKSEASGPCAERILAELTYLQELFAAAGEPLPADYTAAVETLTADFRRTGAPTRRGQSSCASSAPRTPTST